MASLACLLPIVLIAFIGCSGQTYQPSKLEEIYENTKKPAEWDPHDPGSKLVVFEITRTNRPRPPPLGRPYGTGLGSYIGQPAQEEIKQAKNVGRLTTHRKTARYMGPRQFPNLPYPISPAPPLPYDPNGFPSIPNTYPLRPDPPLPPSPYAYFSHSAPGFEMGFYPRNTDPSAYLGGFHPFYLGDLHTGHQGGQGGPDPTCLLCDPDQINCYLTNQGCPDPACPGCPDPASHGITDPDPDLFGWPSPPESTPDQYGPTNF